MHGLGRPDADQDAYDFLMCRPLRQRGIEAIATLFDSSKVEPCCIRDCLKEVSIGRVGVGSWNGRVPPHMQTGDRLRKDKGWIKIGVMVRIAVASPPTRIESKLCKIC